MIEKLIRWSVGNRFLVLLTTVFVTAWGIWAIRTTPIDALPDLSDVQVIIRTSFPGQAPQIVENQVTYPLATTMLSVPGARTVRGFSFFGDSFVYVLFEDGTDLYWARSRVLEYLNQVQGRLPATAKASLGPDATGVGWIYQYALVDRTGRHDLAQLRALQDWFLKFELKSLPNVAEVASVGGMVKQYQVVLDPIKLAAYGITHARVREALEQANRETGGSVLELAEAEYMVRASGYLRSLDDFRAVPLAMVGGVPVKLGDVAIVQLGPEMRRGIAELDGQGEVAGGVVLLRSGKNAQETIAAVKTRLAELQHSLPKGVEIVPTYDRSALIQRAVENLSHKLVEEFLVVALVCAVFLWHLRSALVAIISLPIGVLIAFVVMKHQGINANIMSLGGIAIAIGAMVDAAMVMIENAHKKIEAWQHAHPGETLRGEAHWKVMTDAAVEVGPALFFSLLIITLSFIPVFTLQAQEGRLFGPLAFTKTYAMAAAAGLAVTLVPVLMGYWIRGRIPEETSNPLNRVLIAAYRPLLDGVLRFPKVTLLIAAALFASMLWPLARLGGEFLPPLDEGDLLYMPSALPGLSAAKASQLLQQTDRMIATRAGGRARIRQSGPSGDGDRSRAAGDVRDHHPAQAAGSMAPRHDAGEARGGARPDRQGTGTGEHLDSADPQPHRHAGHGDQEPDRRQGVGHRPRRDRSHCRGRGAGREDGAGCELCARRAPFRRPLHRRADRPARGGTLRLEHRRRAVGGGLRDRRRERRARRWRGSRASRSTCAIRASCATLPRRCASCPSSRRWGNRSRWGRWRASSSPRARPCSRAKTRACPVGCTSTCAGAIWHRW